MANSATFDAKFKEAVSTYEKLKAEWNRKPPNSSKVEELLSLLKVRFPSRSSSANVCFYLEYIR